MLRDNDVAEKIPVLLLVRELGIGGTERQLVETALFLQHQRFIPHVGCFRPDGLRRRDLDSAGVPILHLPVYSFRSTATLKAARHLIRYIRRHQIQVVHSFDAPLNVFAVPIAKAAGVPAVISSQRGHRDLTGTSFKRLLRVTDRLSDAVVVNCESMRQYLVEEERVAESKVRLCYNAVDVERYHRRAGVPGSPGELVIGSVSALRPEKGLDTLIRAFARIDHRRAKLLIVGSGSEEKSLRALAAELQVDAKCHFEPATADVVEWLSQMDVFVLPSRSEALSNALMEAMACGCCPIASRVGGNPELIEHGQNGLLFEVDNFQELATRLCDLLADQPRLQAFAAASAAKMLQFSYARAATTMQDIYESVLSSSARRTNFVGRIG